MKKYYYHDGTAQQGPFDLEELRARNISANTQVWFDPMPAWKPAGTVDELKSLFYTTAAPANQDWNTTQFYYMDGGMQQGPFFLYQLKGKNIASNTQVWYNPLPKWTTASEIPALREVITNTVSASQIPATAPAATVEDWNSKQFYYSDGTGQQGPFTLHQLKGKGITANTPVWYDPLPKWTTAGQVPALKEIISIAAAVTPAAPVAEDWNSKQFYYSDSSGQHGPFKLDQLKGMSITASTPVWYDPLPKWTTAGEVPALKGILVAATAIHTAPAAEDWHSKQFYYSDSAGQHGPFKLDQLKGMGITANTPVWYDPLPKWTTAGEVSALKDIIVKASSQPPAPPSIAVPKKEDDWSNKEFFYIDAHGQQGPFKLDQLKDKHITPGTMVWYEPLTNWTTAGEVAALKDIISSS